MSNDMYTPKEIESIKKDIDNMSHYDLCKLWRQHPEGHPWFIEPELSTHFQDRLFKHFGGFTPEISKAIGW